MSDFCLDPTDEKVALQLIQVRYVASESIHIYSTDNTPGLVASLDAFPHSNHCILHSAVLCGVPHDDYPGAVEAVSGRAEPEVRARLTV